MNIDGVVLSPGKIATVYPYLPAASRIVHHIGRSCQQSATSFTRHTFHSVHRYIARVLAHYTQPVHIMHLNPAESDVATFKNKPSHLVTDNITNGQCVAHFGRIFFLNIEMYYVRCYFFRFGCRQYIPALTVAECFVRRIIFYAMVQVGAPALAVKTHLAIHYFIARITMHLNFHFIAIYLRKRHFRSCRTLKIDV